MNDKFTVYLHKNRINGKRYVGITCQKVNRRWKKGNGYKNHYFKNAIDKYGWDNFEHIILLEGLSQEQAELKEIELILEYKSNDPKLGYNRTSGGFRPDYGTETRKLISRKAKDYHAKHKQTLSPERKQRAIEIFDKYRGLYGFKCGSKNLSSKKVNQYSSDGLFIATWETISDASKVLNINYTGIGKCCSGLLSTSGGYKWEYLGNTENGKITDRKDLRFKAVVQYSKDGKTINRFTSIREAAKFINKLSIEDGISRCCKGKCKTAGGYVWAFD